MIEAIRSWLYANKARRMKRAEVETDADAHNREVVSYATRALAAEKRVGELTIERNALAARLRLIAALETPRCAHVGRKMARIAKGEA